MKVTLSGSGAGITGKYGDADFTDGVATLTLADGDTAVITGLPKDAGYEVEETFTGNDGAPYTVTYTYSDEGKKIAEDETQAVLVTNTRKTTDLTISKKVESGRNSDHEEAFLFTLTFDEPITGKFVLHDATDKRLENPNAYFEFDGSKGNFSMKYYENGILKREGRFNRVVTYENYVIRFLSIAFDREVIKIRSSFGSL